LYALLLTATALELYCIGAALVDPHPVSDALLSMCSALLFSTTLVVAAQHITSSRPVTAWAFVAAAFYAGYKSANFAFTWLQQQSYAGFAWVADVDELATNMLLLASGVTLLACCLQALRESYAARAVLAVQNAALQESRERFLQIADQTQEVVWEVDAQGRYRYVSRASTAVFGYTPEEMTGNLCFYDLHPAPGREAFRARCFEDMQSHVQFCELLNPVQRKDGRIIEVVTNGLPVLAPDGALVGYRGSDRDVTALRQARAQERLLSAAIHSAAESIVITDAEGIILYVNPAFEALSGYSRAEAVGKTPRILKSGYHADAFYSDFWSTIARGETWKGQFTNRRKDGSILDEAATVAPIQDESGKITHFVAVKRDITRQLEMERQLCQRIRLEAVGSLASGIAHDFNSVLSLIVGHAEVGLELLEEQHPARAELEALLRAGYRSCDLIRKLLVFSRRQSSEAGMQLVAPLVRESVALVSAFAPTDVTISEAIQEDAGLVVADAGDLQQVVVNLCTNALQALVNRGGHVQVRLRRVCMEAPRACTVGTVGAGDCALLEVQDDGPGMSPEIARQIFDPFFTTKAPEDGTGLGLATLVGIARGWRAGIQVETALGAGTTIQVFIPLVPAP
jgi:PAS domain S-box-containing protein